MYQKKLQSSKNFSNKKQKKWCNHGFWGHENRIGEMHFQTHWDTHQENHNENTEVEDKQEGKENQSQIITISMHYQTI